MAVKRSGSSITGPGSAIPVAPPQGAPRCPKHGGKMRYEGTSGQFICPESDCDIKAKVKSTKDQFKDSVLKGEFEMIEAGEDKFIVRHLESGAIIDFGDQLQPIGTGELHGQDGQYVMLVQFNGKRTIEGYPGEETA